MSESPPEVPAGKIFDIQRFSIHDGPGIRTTVFLKGCPLDCAWCHNPEGRAGGRQLAFSPALCIGCGYCFRHCTHEGHAMADGKHLLRRENCVGCFCCVEECYSGALEVIGQEKTVEEVMAVVLRDQPFYTESGGGMTVSGGEPLAQPAFTKALLEAAKEAGLQTCVETSGEAPWEALEPLVPLVDLFLYDCKETGAEQHEARTGRTNERILENLRRLDEAGAAIVLRCPIVPGVNLRDDHLAGIAALAGGLANLREVNVMGFHRLGEGKRERLGIEGASPLPEGVKDMTPDDVEAVVERLRRLGITKVSAG